MNLEERALLVKLSINQWSARKTDKEVTREVAESKMASADSGHFRKQLLGKEALKRVNQISGAARSAHYTLTLPWNDDGSRIITTEGYQHYAKVMRDFRVAMMEAVDEFLENYEEYVKLAKTRLGKMFNAEDYPSKDFIRTKFSFDVEQFHVPVSRDFRAKVSNAEAKVIVADIERRTKARLEQAMKDVWERVADVTKKMAERLEEYVPREGLRDAEGVFRDSLVDNVKELAELLPSLNITNDPKLAKIQKELLDHLCAYHPDELRINDNVRHKTAKKAKAIYDKVSQYMA